MRSPTSNLRRLLIILAPFWLTVLLVAALPFAAGASWEQGPLKSVLDWPAWYVVEYSMFAVPGAVSISIAAVILWIFSPPLTRRLLGTGAFILSYASGILFFLLSARIGGTSLNRTFWWDTFLPYLITPYGVRYVGFGLLFAVIVFAFPPTDPVERPTSLPKGNLTTLILILLPLWLLPVLVVADGMLGSSFFTQSIQGHPSLNFVLGLIGVYTVAVAPLLAPGALLITLGAIMFRIFQTPRRRIVLALAAFVIGYTAPIVYWLTELRMGGTHMNNQFWREALSGLLTSETGNALALIGLCFAGIVFIFPPVRVID